MVSRRYKRSFIYYEVGRKFVAHLGQCSFVSAKGGLRNEDQFMAGGQKWQVVKMASMAGGQK
jgi:hypothetical protein